MVHSILITGAKGQLGRELQKQLANGKSALGPLPEALKGARVTGADLPEADLSDVTAAKKALADSRADIVLNCAAFTNVDGCDTEPDTAYRGNALLPRNLALACAETGARLVHVSTDYVFSGAAKAPVAEYEQPRPISGYGKTKLAGEEFVKSLCPKWFIVRTAWLYGQHGGNFVKTIARVAREKGQVTVVDDQLGNPTNAEDLAHHMLKLCVTGEYGIYHITGGGVCSWFEFAQKIVEYGNIHAAVTPCSTEEYAKIKPGAAPRPAFSALEHTMLRCTVGDEMRPWQEALKAYMEAGYC